MIHFHWLIGMAMAAAQPQTPPEPASAGETAVRPESFSLGNPPAGELTKTEAQNILSKCDHRRVEASAEGLIDGAMKRRKITLCAAPGDSHSQWITKLQSAIAWVEAQPGLSDEVKAKLVADFRNEIARPQTAGPAPAEPMPALPAADALVATVPPMPPPLGSPAAARSALQTTVTAASPLARPALTIQCLRRGEPGSGSRCGRLARSTLLAVRADADLTGPAMLRFVRKGRERAEIKLAMLRAGQIVRLRVPPEVCQGVVGTNFSIQIVAGNPTTGRAAQVTDTLGPYPIDC